MQDLPNGFTGSSEHDSSFVSARDAIKRSERVSQASNASGGLFDDESQETTQRSVPLQGKVNIWSVEPENDITRFLSTEETDKVAPSFDPEKLEQISERDRRWAWVEIDLSAIRHNTSEIKHRLSTGTRLCAVVKADGYGHGAVQCARMALNSGADYLAVATVDEAIELRDALIKAPLLILNEPPISSIPLLLAYDIMPSVYTPEFAISYAEAADALSRKAPFHLKVNTGMNRIGVRYDEVVTFMRQVGFHRALELVGTFTHFATADCPEVFEFQTQVRRFVEAVNALQAAGIDPGIIHAANSAAIIRYPEVHFDMVRLGISLYGFYPCHEAYGMCDLVPAMSVHARITDTRYVAMGEGVSYGLNYRSPGSVKICTVPLGYADGLRRGLSGNTNFIVDGRAFRQVGNICMDQCMFEVDLRTYGTQRRVDPEIGDEVIIVGTQGDAVVTIDEMADKLGTNQHEIAIGFGCSRLPRLYQ